MGVLIANNLQLLAIKQKKKIERHNPYFPSLFFQTYLDLPAFTGQVRFKSQPCQSIDPGVKTAQLNKAFGITRTMLPYKTALTRVWICIMSKTIIR